MMSDATEYALFRLSKGDRKAALKRVDELGNTKQVLEHRALLEALEDPRVDEAADAKP